MRDESFAYFVSVMGEGEERVAVSPEQLTKYQGRLPPTLLGYWEKEGFARYCDGAFWTEDPTDYREILEAWLIGTKLETNLPRMHVVARSAFGALYVFAEGTGPCGVIDCPVNSVFITDKKLRPQNERQQHIATQVFFSNRSLEECDLKTDKGRPLFRSALKKLGKLQRGQMYGFIKPLVSDGAWSVENLQIVPLREHLIALRALAKPRFPFG